MYDRSPAYHKPTIDGLVTAGFRRVGTWRSTTDGAGIELDFLSDKLPGIYAYAVNGTVQYVGSAQRGLHGRFQRYAKTKTLRTSARIRGEIMRCLANAQSVEVYVLSPPPHQWNGLPVDLIAGLEEALIRCLRPVWNKRSNRDDL